MLSCSVDCLFTFFRVLFSAHTKVFHFNKVQFIYYNIYFLICAFSVVSNKCFFIPQITRFIPILLSKGFIILVLHLGFLLIFNAFLCEIGGTTLLFYTIQWKDYYFSQWISLGENHLAMIDEATSLRVLNSVSIVHMFVLCPDYCRFDI